MEPTLSDQSLPSAIDHFATVTPLTSMQEPSHRMNGSEQALTANPLYVVETDILGVKVKQSSSSSRWIGGTLPKCPLESETRVFASLEAPIVHLSSVKVSQRAPLDRFSCRAGPLATRFSQLRPPSRTSRASPFNLGP